MSILPAHANGGVRFNINPILIDSTTIRKLETFPHGSGEPHGIWKCSMPTPSGTPTIVAVKCIWFSRAYDEELIYKIGRRIRREAYVWITLSHDHILPFLGITMRNDFGRFPALVSPWMENRSLSHYLKLEFPQLSDHRKLELIRQLAAGLCYLHEDQNIVHGDLTGFNVLVDDSGKLRIAGFGLWMFLVEADDETFNLMYSRNARWMGPEFVPRDSDEDDSEEDSDQLLPHKPTKAGDIYSFGCVMLQILSGKEPYAWIKSRERVVAARILGRAPFNAVQISMSSSLRQLSSQCLSREPGGRPSIVEITTIMGHPVTRQPDATRHWSDRRRNPYPGPSNDSPHHLSARHSTTASPACQQHDSAHLSSHQQALPVESFDTENNEGNNRARDEDTLSFAQAKPDPILSLVAPEAMLRNLTEYITKTGEFADARGGFGEIWKCILQVDQEPINVAVKSFSVYASEIAGTTNKKSKKIHRELKTCARLEHQNILPVHGYTTGFGPLMAIVSPWAENGNLNVYLEKEGDLPVIKRFQILRDIAAGLRYLHANNVTHGDLTGTNVLIHGDGTACIADFGLSLLSSELTSISQVSSTFSIYGNVRWLAPELIALPEDDSHVRPNKCSDVYSFGGVILQVLTSKIPYYYYQRDANIIWFKCSGKKTDRSRYPTLSSKYWDLIDTCRSVAPDDRPSVERVAEEIRNELESLSSS